MIGWRSGRCGYRRFFSITSLAGLRQEDRAVFDATHVEVGRWFREGLVDGVRIDHPDGLSDPAGYLAWLRELTGPQAWIVIEKILAVDEALEPTLPVAGTTGYDALREIGGVFVDPAGARPLTDLFDAAGVAYDALPESARRLKAEAATDTLRSELDRVRRTIVAATGSRPPRPARCGGDAAQPHRRVPLGLPGTVGGAADRLRRYGFARGRSWPHPLAIVAAALAVSTEADVRLQQLCGAATAKSMEDCLFYRDARLVSLNEVGGEPRALRRRASRSSITAPRCGRSCGRTTMVTLSTHDTKRGEDVRARIGVLSQVPSLWAELVGKWALAAPPPDAATGLFLLQNVFGVWPVDGSIDTALRERLHAYAEKAIREAALHTSWNEPDAEFESAVHTLARRGARRPGRHRADVAGRPARPARPQRRAGPEADRAHRARRARRLSGHRAVGRQPRRPRQPPAGGLRGPRARH